MKGRGGWGSLKKTHPLPESQPSLKGGVVTSVPYHKQCKRSRAQCAIAQLDCSPAGERVSSSWGGGGWRRAVQGAGGMPGWDHCCPITPLCGSATSRSPLILLLISFFTVIELFFFFFFPSLAHSAFNKCHHLNTEDRVICSIRNRAIKHLIFCF